MLLSKEEKEYIRSAFNENRKSVDIRIAFLLDIIEKLDEIEKKLDALTPSLDVDEVVDSITNQLREEIEQTKSNDISKREIDYLREVAEEEVISAFASHKPLEQK